MSGCELPKHARILWLARVKVNRTQITNSYVRLEKLVSSRKADTLEYLYLGSKQLAAGDTGGWNDQITPTVIICVGKYQGQH